MNAPYVGFLDDTSISEPISSPVKTSTVVKENIKWNEEAFFKRQNLAQASESLFLPPSDSPIGALTDPVNIAREPLQKLRFPLNDTSIVSDGANSSLGILQVENLGLSDGSFQELTKFTKKKQKSKKKLQRTSNVCLGDKDYEFKQANLEGKFFKESYKASLASLNESNKEAEEKGSDSSSSDIEYDGTNIPELNMDCDILALVDSDRARVSRNNILNSSNESGFVKTNATSTRSTYSGNSFISSQLAKDALLKSDVASRESSVNVRQSIFENFQPLYDSLYHKLGSEKESVEKNKGAKNPQTVRVCPFLGMSSFEVEPILKNNQSSNSEVENTRLSENPSVDFCPEQISARSSSFKSSRQFESSSSENSNFYIKGNFLHSLPIEDLENEVLCGSHFQVSSIKEEFQIGENIEEKGSEFSAKSANSDTLTENISKNASECGNLPLGLDLQCKNVSDFVSCEGQNWCSHLGLSEADFFSSDDAKEMLQKDKEAFEKQQLFKSPKSQVSGGGDNWSFASQQEITPPSWMTELSPDQNVPSKRHVSVSTVIGARSENLGSLSEDAGRERPYFGKPVVTPPKPHPSSFQNPFEPKSSIGSSSENSILEQFRVSDLSELLNGISISDPVLFASKIVEKYPPLQKGPKLRHTSDPDQDTRDALSDIEESQNTLLRSASANDVSKQTDNDADSDHKSTASEPVHSMNNSLNFSVGSSRESIKKTNSGSCTNYNLLPSGLDAPQQFSRPTSSCSSACNTALPLDNALSLQYGCMRYANSCTGSNQNCFHNINLLQQTGNSGLPCPHVYVQHGLQPNLLSIGAPNPFQSVIPNALSGPLRISGTPASFLEIQVPSELCFPEKIALGDSQEMNLTIRNSVSVGCYYQISYISAYLNESPLPVEMSGLSYNKTVPSNVGNITDIKLILAPKYEGKIEVNLQVDAFFNSLGQALNSAPIATARSKVQYEVLRPSITMLSKGNDTLNLGQVVAGSTFVEYISVTNNCEVSVPLRISLSNDSLQNQIYFGLKEMDRQKHPSSGALKFLTPKVLLYRIPASKNETLPSSFDIPVVFESINGRIDSTITAAIETPTLSEVLAFIKISAVGGCAKLILKDSNQNPLILKAFKGATCNHSVTVLNAGSLPVVYDIHIDGDNDVLSVSPSSLNMQPKQCATISVTFTPSSYLTVKGNLLAAAEPHGQVFTVTEIIGQVKANSVKSQLNTAPMRSLRPTRDSTEFVFESSNFIECNRKYLAWGGADINEACVAKGLTIRNPKQDEIQLKLFIKAETQGFIFIDDFYKRIAGSALTFPLKSKEEKLVSVAFIPKSVVSYSGLLCIKSVSENDSRLFTIPLSGYGGKSVIRVLGLPDGEGTGYCLDVDASNVTDVVHKNITIHNAGCRPAFVKLHITYDGLVQNIVEKQTVIHPSEFVLMENEKKNVLVSINCKNKNLISNNEVISVVYGDEIMRQRLRRKLKSSSSKNQNLVYNINFNVPYDGEDKVPNDPSYQCSPKDDSLFYSHLKKLMIHIFFNGQNTSFSGMSFGALSEVQENFSNLTLNSTILSRRLTIEGHSPPVKESFAMNMSRLSLPVPFDINSIPMPVTTDSALTLPDCLKDLKLDSWVVQPEELIIDTDNKDKRIVLKNYSNSDLRFKVEWTVDIITVSPVSGILSAKGEIGLRLTLINNNHNKLLEDYHGNIKILCDGIEKNVDIKVLKDHKKRSGSPVLSASNDSLRSGFLGDSFFMDSTLVEPTSSSLNTANIFNFPKEIKLQKTRQDILSETILAVCNPTKLAVTWSIHPTTMLFTQPFDDSIDSTSSAFEFRTTRGTLMSEGKENIVIKFLPRSVAHFSQFFELALITEDGKKQTCTIKVQGEAYAGHPIGTLQSVNYAVIEKKQKTAVKKKIKAGIFTETEVCKFPVTASGHKSTLTITLKNSTDKTYKLTSVKPNLPFILNFSSLKLSSQKYLSVPVHFKPQRAGCYESEVKFVCENGYELLVKLNGSCFA